MRIVRNTTYLAFIAVLFSMVLSVSAQVRPYRVTDRQMQNLLNRLENKTDVFRRQLDAALDNSRGNDTLREENITEYITNFENATDELKRNFERRISTEANVQEVLNRALVINQFMANNRGISRAAQNQWSSIRVDLNTLANYYRVSWNWNNQVPVNNRAYFVSDAQVQSLLARLETLSDSFRRQADSWLKTSRYDRNENLSSYIDDFENSTDSLKRNFDERDSVAGDVEAVLQRGAVIDRFVRANRMSYQAERDWNLIRNDLSTLANYYRVSWNWNNPVYPVNNRAYFVTDAEVQSLLARLETRSDSFRRQTERWLDNSRYNNTNSEDNVAEFIKNFENATDNLKRNFDERDSVAGDVEEVLQRGALIDRFIRANRMSYQAEREWSLIRNDLSTLANYYRVSWNWNNPVYPTNPNNSFDARLTGTYRLNVAQSDNVSEVVSRAISNNNYNTNQRERIQRNLERRLMSPDMFVIEKNGQKVLLGSSLSPQVSLEADGVSRSETNNNGRAVQTKVAANSTDLTISYEGDRINDFYVTFMPLNNNQLRVTRKIYLENRNEMIMTTSVYDKTDTVARWNNVNNQQDNQTNGNVYSDFIVANNTKMVAKLDDSISTKTMQDGDTFTMTVISPSQYNGAVIEGRVNGQKSGVVSGRATMTLEFETIRLTNGNTYRFAGIVEQVREPNGDTVTVNNEGTVRDGSQTKKTVTRAGIGAALGAIIGAIAGGGKGAIIGAGVGAGAGAGSVVLQGRDNLELPVGTEFNITATAPNNVGYNR